jgi:hypothetical protein
VLALFKRKPDPLSDRARELDDEIRKLEREIERLAGRIGSEPSSPRLRSTVRPHAQPDAPLSSAPVFEEIDFTPGDEAPHHGRTTEHFNEHGVRKFDLLGTLRRLRHHLRGPEKPNHKLVNYLASGSIHGLRPLRYEKRVARNRFIAMTLLLAVILYGLLYMFLNR